MFAQIGNIEFKNLTSFLDLTSSAPSITPQHGTISGKPKLQPTIHGLKEYRISIRLHVAYCNPTEELKRITEMYEKSEPVPFIMGDGTIVGNFTLTSLDFAIESAFPDGSSTSILVSFALLEFVAATSLATGGTAPSLSAPSVGNKVVVSSPSNNSPGCAKEVSRHISVADSNKKALMAGINERGGIIYPENKSKALTSLEAMETTLKILGNENLLQCTKAHPEVKSTSNATIPAINSCRNYIISGNVVMATMEANTISRNIDSLKLATTPLIKSSIARQ